MREEIQVGFHVFVAGRQDSIGGVRKVAPLLVIYVENGGEFVVPNEAVEAVHSQKVILNRDKLDPSMLQAIEHAHDAEVRGL
ncbi:MAG TPA: hypothetical protein VHM64_14880 [Candidatus Binatia bacterium]|nr:hypothetical protein [Candidatus Binatia bacterium]